MAKWRFVCNMFPEMHIAGIGQFKNGILEVDDDEIAKAVMQDSWFGGIIKLMDDNGQIHETIESYLKAQEGAGDNATEVAVSDEGVVTEQASAKKR